MDIKHTDIKPLVKEISITIEQGDYAAKVKSELKKLGKKGSFKGFRKGKVPMSFLKRTYGESVLASTVWELLEENLNDYIDAHEMRPLGKPMSSDRQEAIDFDIRNQKDYTFIFDVGVAPEVELQGFDESASYERYDVQIPDDIVEKDLKEIRNQLGEQVEVEEDINDNDIVVLEGKELEDGEIKENGWETAFSVHVGSLDEAAQELLLGKDKGYSFHYDIFNLAKEGSESFVRKHYLNMDEDEDIEVNHDFQLTVDTIKRLKPAEMNEEFFERAFGGEVSTEEEAREHIRSIIKNQFGSQADIILSYEMQRGLLEANDLELPEEFLQKWIKIQEEEDGESLSDKEFQDFLRNTRWALIVSEIRDTYNLEVQQEEIAEYMRGSVMQQFQGMQLPPEFMQQFVQNFMNDEEKVREAADRIMGNKVVETFKDNVTIVPIEVSIDEFNKLSKEFNESLQALNSDEEE